jgi:hypothetical protein
LFWKIFPMVLLLFGKRQEKGTEGNKAENLENDRIFLDLNNRDLSGCFGKFLQWLIICTFGEEEKRTRQPSRWWLSGKSLGSRGLLPLWFQVRALWLLIWWSLEAYMVVNFRARGISRGARKLARTSTLN